MSKVKKEGIDENPFGSFSLIKGEFKAPDGLKNESVEDDIIDTDDSVIEDQTTDEELERIKAADKALEEVAKKQAKANSKKETIVDDEEDDTEDTEEDNTSTDNSDSPTFKDFTKGLYEKGVIDFDDTDEDFEDSEDGIEKLINKTVENRINKWTETLPDEYSQFLNYVQNGGKPKDFLDVYYGNHSWADFKIDNENAQKLAVEQSLRLAGEAEEDIKEMVDEWEINGSLEKRAKSAITKLQKHEAAEKKALVEQQKELAKRQEEANKQYWESFKEDLNKKEDIKGFKLTPKTRNELWDFMTQVNKSGKTAYQEATEKEKDSSLLFAYFAMKNFDINKLEKQVTTKVSSKLSGVLKNYSKSSKDRISSGTNDENYGTNPFAGFK